MLSTTHWWTTPRRDHEPLERALREFLSQHRRAGYRYDDFRLAWFYQRDYLIQRYGSLQKAMAMGPGVQGHFPWLAGVDSIPSPNLVKSVVDTSAAWLISEAPPLGCKASGASFEAQPALERYGAAIDGLFNTPSCKEIIEQVGRDGLLRGIGWCMPAYESGQIVMRRLLPWQVTLDAVDARGRSPRTCIVESTEDRGALRAWLEELNVDGLARKLAEIRDAPAIMGRSVEAETVYDYELSEHGLVASDHVRVFYAWRAASTPTASDGRYVVAVETRDGPCVLIDQEYSATTIGPVWWSPYPNDEGVGGTGLGHLMVPWQEAMDRSFLKLQRALDRYGHIKLVTGPDVFGQINLQSFVEAGITVLEAPAGMATDPAVPKVYDPQVLRREDIEWIQRILEWSASTYGINQLMQQGTGGAVPSASAVALVERADQSRDRFADVTGRWSGFRLELGSRTLGLLDGVLKVNPEFRAAYEIRGVGASTTWAELTRQVNGCSISLEVRGDASMSRAGRLARAVEYGDRGMISPDELREVMLDDPDLRKAARESLSGYRLVEWQLQGVIASTDGQWWDYVPDEVTPLRLAMDKAEATIRIAITQGAEPETIERLHEYRLMASKMLEQQSPAAGAITPPPGAAAQGSEIPGMPGGDVGMPANLGV